MNRHTAIEPIELDIVSALADAPRVFHRSNIRGIPRPKSRTAGSEMELDNGNIRRWRFGPKAQDIVLDCSKLNEATKLALEEIEDRQIRVHCYPSFPASAGLFAPLLRGVKADPVTGLYYGGVHASTSHLYMLRADPAHPIWFELVDPASPIVAREIRTGNGTSTRFPLGQGIFFPSMITNRVMNSLLGGAVGATGPTDWTMSGGTWGTDCGVIVAAESFCGIPALYIWGTSVRIQSGWFNVTAGQKVTHSIAYRTDGELQACIEFDVAGGTCMAPLAGSGWTTQVGTAPASATKARLTFAMSAGTYCEIGGPQALQNGAFDWPKVPFFIGSDAGIAGEIHDCYADFHAPIEVGIYPDTPVVVVAGLFQPAWDVGNIDPTQTLATIWTDRAADHSMQLDMADFTAGMKFHVRQDGTIKASSGTISPAHALGDTYAWIMYGGFTGAAMTGYKVGMKAMKVGETAACATAETGTSLAEYQVWDRLRVGASLVGNTSADGIIANVFAGVMNYTDLSILLAQMANRDLLDLWRGTIGRLFYVDLDLEQSPYQRGYWSGSVSLRQAELL